MAHTHGGFPTPATPRPPLLDRMLRAVEGWCDHNRTFMVGEGGAGGWCERSCRVCTRCQPDDHACRVANRERSGYIGDLDPELAQLFP